MWVNVVTWLLFLKHIQFDNLVWSSVKIGSSGEEGSLAVVAWRASSVRFQNRKPVTQFLFVCRDHWLTYNNFLDDNATMENILCIFFVHLKSALVIIIIFSWLYIKAKPHTHTCLLLEREKSCRWFGWVEGCDFAC